MQNSDNTLIARRIGLIPREPVIDFGTVEIGDTVSPQRFTVELAPDTQGLITTDVDCINIEPMTFVKGQTEITVRLLTDKLQRGQQLQGTITASITKPITERRNVPVFVKVREGQPILKISAVSIDFGVKKVPKVSKVPKVPKVFRFGGSFELP